MRKRYQNPPTFKWNCVWGCKETVLFFLSQAFKTFSATFFALLIVRTTCSVTILVCSEISWSAFSTVGFVLWLVWPAVWPAQSLLWLAYRGSVVSCWACFWPAHWMILDKGFPEACELCSGVVRLAHRSTGSLAGVQKCFLILLACRRMEDCSTP